MSFRRTLFLILFCLALFLSFALYTSSVSMAPTVPNVTMTPTITVSPTLFKIQTTSTPVSPTSTPVVVSPTPTATADSYYQSQILEVGSHTKHILVVLSEQKLYLYEGPTQLASFLISSGVAEHPTVTGVFKIWIKLDSTTMSGEGYYLENVLYTMYFYDGYGIHGTWWHNNFGTPMSHGCINMSEADAEIVYNWAEVGTFVQVIP